MPHLLRLQADNRWLNDELYNTYDKALAAATNAANELPVGTMLMAWPVHVDKPDELAAKWPTAGWLVKQRPFGTMGWLEPQSVLAINQYIKQQQAQEVSS